MSRLTPLLTSTAFALVAGAPAAFADLTAAQAWGDWRDYMQGMGYALTASENASGGTLTVSDINVTMELPEAQGAMNVSLGQLTFVENGDGSVDVVFPQTTPLAMQMTPQGDGSPSSFNMSYAQTGMKITMSGSPDDLTYVTSADNLTMSLDGLTAGGETYGSDRARFVLSVNDLAATSTMKVGALRDYQQDISSGQVSYDIFMAPPDVEGTFEIKGQMAQVSFEGGGDIPLNIAQVSDMRAMLDAGFAFAGAFTFGAGNMQLKTVDPENSVDLSTNTGGGTLSMQMGTDGLAYEGTQENVNMSVQVTTLPFPITLSMAESGFGMKMPLTKSAEAQDFALAMNLTQFTMSDMIWGIFDPTGQLPRDPATIALDMSGKAKMLVDLMDPRAAEAMAASGAQPGEVEALSINTLLVEAIGAKLTGSGNITFDNADKQTYPGMPKPVGGVDLSLVGGNGLIDKLVAMGIVQQEQAMGARMMMGLFAVPGDAPDSLKSKIEFNAEGQILANGQRIK